MEGTRHRAIATLGLDRRRFRPNIQDASILRRIVRERGGRLALDCRVIEPGRVVVGDPVEVLEG